MSGDGEVSIDTIEFKAPLSLLFSYVAKAGWIIDPGLTREPT